MRAVVQEAVFSSVSSGPDHFTGLQISTMIILFSLLALLIKKGFS